MCQRCSVKGIDLRPAAGGERHHAAVARGGRLTIEGLAQPERQFHPPFVGIAAPADFMRGIVVFRHASCMAQRGQHGVVERGRADEIVGAEHEVGEHDHAQLVFAAPRFAARLVDGFAGSAALWRST